MNILITGGCGYLGSVLVPKLLGRGHKLRILDHGYFGLSHMKYFPSEDLIQEDIRSLENNPALLDRLLDRCECVIHLAAISNDPSAELNNDLTDQVNYRGTAVLAEAAKKRGIRFIFSSSCSVYGCSDAGEIDESAALNPLTAYAESKVKAEKVLLGLSSPEWNPIILRNGTLYGYSPRMRFDLVVNLFSMYSALYNEIKLFGNGDQWRPFLHVSDCARAFCFFAEISRPRHSVYNISFENRSLEDLSRVFLQINPRLKISRITDEPDQRNYRVSVGRMREENFVPQITISTGAEELHDKIINGTIPNPEANFYNNVKWMKELILNAKICLKPY